MDGAKLLGGVIVAGALLWWSRHASASSGPEPQFRPGDRNDTWIDEEGRVWFPDADEPGGYGWSCPDYALELDPLTGEYVPPGGAPPTYPAAMSPSGYMVECKGGTGFRPAPYTDATIEEIAQAQRLYDELSSRFDPTYPVGRWKDAIQKMAAVMVAGMDASEAERRRARVLPLLEAAPSPRPSGRFHGVALEDPSVARAEGRRARMGSTWDDFPAWLAAEQTALDRWWRLTTAQRETLIRDLIATMALTGSGSGADALVPLYGYAGSLVGVFPWFVIQWQPSALRGLVYVAPRTVQFVGA